MEESSRAHLGGRKIRAETVTTALAAAAALAAIVFLIANLNAVGQFFREAHYQPLSISTSPSGATVFLDGNDIGQSPITVNTAPGPHTLVVRKEGFQEHSVALSLERDRYERGEDKRMRLVHKAEPWLANIELEPIAVPSVAAEPQRSMPGPVESKGSPQSPVRREEHSQVDAVLPESVAARLSLLEQRIQIVDDKAEFAATLKLSILGILVTIFLALVVQVLGSFRK